MTDRDVLLLLAGANFGLLLAFLIHMAIALLGDRRARKALAEAITKAGYGE